MAVEVGPVAKQWNDDEILGRLAQAWQAAGDVSADFVAAGKAAFACPPTELAPYVSFVRCRRGSSICELAACG